MRQEIINHLSEDYPWRDRFCFLPEVGSTNDQLKQLARQGAPHGTVLMAGRQTGGHGRMGRSFHSPQGAGVYLSMLLRPDCAPLELMHLTCAVAVAMCDAVEAAAQFRPGIKWTNDLVSGQRKLGGILTELRLTPHGRVDYAIVGIGINCCQTPADFPRELQDVAGSLSMVAGKPISPAALAAAMLDSLATMDSRLLTDKPRFLAQYRRDCVTLGQEISVVRGDSLRHGKALDIDDDGALLVAYPDGTQEAVNSGEVSIRGMYGYV